MTIHLATAATFIFVQTIAFMGGELRLNIDVSGMVPYTVQGKDLVIL